MSNSLLTIIRDNIPEVKGPVRAVLIALADRANDSGNCWPSKATIAKDAGVCLSTVKTALRKLRRVELITWTNTTTGDGDAGCNNPQNPAEKIEIYRKAAERGDAVAQCKLGTHYAYGEGLTKDFAVSAKWMRKAANQGVARAQYMLGVQYADGSGVHKDSTEACKWFRKAAVQGHAEAQLNLGYCYESGSGVTKDSAEAVKWYRMAADQGDSKAQYNLGLCYFEGSGVVKNAVEAYKWWLLAGGQDNKDARKYMAVSERRMTREQIAEGQKLARDFKPRKAPAAGVPIPGNGADDSIPRVTGTGFFITDGGFLITNRHVVEGATQVRLATSAGLIAAKVVKVDAANDFALLKADGKFTALPVTSSRAVKLGASMATVGFPNTGIQGFSPKLAKGEIAGLSGAADDARYFQISVPVQPGNSGGALVDERGNVVGVVSAKLNAAATLAASGALPENVNYAVKSSFLLGFLESVPEVANALKEPNNREVKFEDVVKSAEQAAVLVLVYWFGRQISRARPSRVGSPPSRRKPCWP